MQRISIIGNTGTGKSTLARELAAMLALKNVSLDELFWLPNWANREPKDVIKDVKAAASEERWVIEGNYRWLRHEIWARADTIIWLDYPLPFTFMRLFRRTLHRIMYHESVCNGNYESWSRTLSSDSILLWCLKMHRRRLTDYPEWLGRPQYEHTARHIFSSADQTQEWLDSLPSLGSPVPR
jgi:adenylate kinase family enzyme